MGASFLASNDVRLDMSYVRCPKGREYVARLWTLVVSMKGANGLSDQVDVYPV